MNGAGKMRELRILLGESLVELFDFIQEDLQLVGRWQNGHSEMVGPILLAKPAARYEADSSLLQHLHAIKHVRLLSLFRGLFDSLFRDGYARKGVHSTLHRVAADALDRVENLLCKFGLFC